MSSLLFTIRVIVLSEDSGGSVAKIVGSNIFIIDKICKERIYNIGGSKIVKHVSM